jgi:hypothetical protein
MSCQPLQRLPQSLTAGAVFAARTMRDTPRELTKNPYIYMDTTSNSPAASNTGGALLTDAQASIILGGLLPHTLRDWRKNRGLPFIRLTSKVIRYRLDDLNQWVNSHRVTL